VRCILCGLFAWFSKRLPTPCIADRPEVRAKFLSWRGAQTNDRELLERDPQRDAIEATRTLRRRDPTAAFPRFLKLAEGGSVYSMLCVGWLYGHGVGVQEDAVEAERWNLRALKHGSHRARLQLADLYLAGADFDASETILQPGVDEHWAPALYAMAVTKLRQPATTLLRESARVLLEDASALGDVGAQWALARRMARGWFGWRRIPRGFRLMSDACERTLALLETDGRGVGNRRRVRCRRPCRASVVGRGRRSGD
jgi:hypothetical protein